MRNPLLSESYCALSVLQTLRPSVQGKRYHKAGPRRRDISFWGLRLGKISVDLPLGPEFNLSWQCFPTCFFPPGCLGDLPRIAPDCAPGLEGTVAQSWRELKQKQGPSNFKDALMRVLASTDLMTMMTMLMLMLMMMVVVMMMRVCVV